MRKIILLLLITLLAGCAAVPAAETEAIVETTAAAAIAPTETTETTEPPTLSDEEATVASLLESMTTEQKVGQLFFARCPDTDAAALAEQYGLGGYILYGQDFQDKTADEVIQTIASYQSVSRVPMLIGTDEEGGTVVRASMNSALFAAQAQSPQTLYTQGGMDAIVADAHEKSQTLLALGVNVNLAPVADVSTDPNDFIYARAFGQDAQATAEYVAAVVAAMNEEGIGSVLKHFPGYGSNADTHTGSAIDERPYETFVSEDYLPFAAGIEAGAYAVMVSHNVVTCMDAENPASLSAAVHKELRTTLGFDGVILTDDLDMEAVTEAIGDESVAVKAILAGNDILLTRDFETQIASVLEAVADGTITVQRLDASVTRILTWKYRLGLFSAVG